MSPDLSLLKEKTLENLLNIDDADESGDFNKKQNNRDKLKPDNIKEKKENFEINYQVLNKFILV